MSSRDPYNENEFSVWSKQFEDYKAVFDRSMKEIAKSGSRAEHIIMAPEVLRPAAFFSRFDEYRCFPRFQVSICWRLFSRSEYGSREVTNEDITREVVYCCGQEIFDKALKEGSPKEFSDYCDMIRELLAKETKSYNSGFRGRCRKLWKKVKNSFRARYIAVAMHSALPLHLNRLQAQMQLANHAVPPTPVIPQKIDVLKTIITLEILFGRDKISDFILAIPIRYFLGIYTYKDILAFIPSICQDAVTTKEIERNLERLASIMRALKTIREITLLSLYMAIGIHLLTANEKTETVEKDEFSGYSLIFGSLASTLVIFLSRHYPARLNRYVYLGLSFLFSVASLTMFIISVCRGVSKWNLVSFLVPNMIISLILSLECLILLFY